MFAAYLIMLREGVEAALIVGIVAGYLKQTGRARMAADGLDRRRRRGRRLSRRSGSALSGAERGISAADAGDFRGRRRAARRPSILTSMVFWMKKAARSIKGELQHFGRRRAAAGDRQGLALVGMAFFAVGREGLESMFFLLAIAQQSEGWRMPLGAALGLASAVGVGFAIYWGGGQARSAPLLPLDRRLHPVCRRGPARRRACAPSTRPGSGTACRAPPST